MIRVEFLGPIGKEPIDVDVANLAELSALLKKDGSMEKWLQNSAVAINDVLVSSLDVSLKSGDKVAILPPVCGG